MMFRPDDQYNEEEEYWAKKMDDPEIEKHWKELFQYFDDECLYFWTELIDDENLLALAKQYNEAQRKILEIDEKRRKLNIHGLFEWQKNED